MMTGFPAQLRNGQIIAYIDGTADQATRALVEDYVAHHAELATEIEDIARLHAQLADALHHVTMPSPLELGEYLLGLLSPARTRAINEAIDIYPHLAREVAALQEFLDTPDFEPMTGSQGLSWPGMNRPLSQQVHVLIATIVENLGNVGTTPALAGIRGELRTRGQEQEQLTFEAGNAQVILEVQDDPNQPTQKTLLGLVIGLDASEMFHAFLYQDNTLSNEVTIDDIGNFVFEQVAPGLYELILSSPQSSKEIHIQELQI